MTCLIQARDYYGVIVRNTQLVEPHYTAKHYNLKTQNRER